MRFDTVLAFAALSAVLVAIPGPAVVLVLKSALLRGRGSAMVTALGILTADLTWAAASVAGLTAVLVSSQVAFTAIRVIGAGYLIHLGIKLMRTREFTATVPAGSEGRPHRVGRRRAFVEGFLSDLSNPKTVLVYASVIPQFLVASSPASDALVLGVVFALLGFVGLVVHATVFGIAGGMLRNARAMRNVLRGGGGLLTIFGVGLLVERPSH